MSRKPETSRRALLGAIASLPAAATLAKAETPALGLPGGPDDHIPALYADETRVVDLVNGGHYASEDEADALMDAWAACDVQAIATPATTPAGAIASIKWVRGELLEFGFAVKSDPDDKGAKLILALLDGALTAVRGGHDHA